MTEELHEPEYLNRKQVAALLGVSEKWLAQSGKLSGPPRFRFGGMIRYQIDDVRRWAKQQKVAS
jgi:predicted DNA-binding transcriptional regulator AlpA